MAISNTLLIVYNWWFALNLSIFKDILIVSNLEKVSFMLGMTFRNFQLLNFISWILVYLYLIVLLLKRKVRLLPACIAVFLTIIFDDSDLLNRVNPNRLLDKVVFVLVFVIC